VIKNAKAAIAACMLIAGLTVPSAANAQSYLQCAPFARAFSGIQLFGAAASWWNQAIGKYAQGAAPKVGSVLVFKALSSMRSGHVATVTQVVSDRIIKVTHANWGGMKGQIEHDVTVVDSSANNDWSAVKVWYRPIGTVGTKSYPTYGFIYSSARAVAVEASTLAARAANAIHAAEHRD
jgi:surface antigen